MQGRKAALRVISLVPSWTETLIWADVSIVGRTRFCIHPWQRCRSIPEVGGTKDINWQKVEDLAPDLLILDAEENTRTIYEEAPVPVLVTNISSTTDVAEELSRLARALENPRLNTLSVRWRRIIQHKRSDASLDELPGVLTWIQRPSKHCRQMLYLVWQSPWMTVTKDTFIGSVLSLLGYGKFLVPLNGKYPRIHLDDFDRSLTLLLFASEPYPFRQPLKIASAEGFPSALVDGEKFSWFGLRSLHFLEEHLGR